MIKCRLKRNKAIRKIYSVFRLAVLNTTDFFTHIFQKNTLGRSLIMVFDRQCQLEYERLLLGNDVYKRSTKNKANEYYLRRQLHRIEKGLLHKNKRMEFGLDFILNSVEIFESISSQEIDSDFIRYGYGVFFNYFSKTESSNRDYLAAENKFMKLKDIYFNESLIREYKNKNSGSSVFDELVNSRKSIRHFKDQCIDNKIIEKAIGLARCSPTGCNRQPYRFIVIKDKNLLQKCSSLPPGGHGNAFGAPVLIFVIGDHSAFPTTSSSHEAYIDASLASMTLVYGLESYGVSTCFMNWPHNYKLNKKAFNLLNLKPYEIIVTSIAVGYAEKNATYAFSKRREVKEILEYL